MLTTGPTGALLLPGGKVEPPTTFMTEICHTYPGDGSLAAAGRVAMVDGGAWAGKQKVEIAHRCGPDAVVVRMPVGRGEAVWWSSAVPLTNAELKTDADLRLLLLSLGEGRTVLWDESLHETVPGLWDAARGLPVWWLIAQVILLAVLLVLSFSRRNGLLRSPVMLPQKFAGGVCVVDGDLYDEGACNDCSDRRGAAKTAARDCAGCGVPQVIVEEGPRAIMSALKERLGGEWATVGLHLEKANDAMKESPTCREALAISRALSEDAERIRVAARSGRTRDAGAVKVA